MKSGTREKRAQTAARPSRKPAASPVELTFLLKTERWKKLLPRYQSVIRRACDAFITHSPIKKNDGKVAISVVLADDRFIRELNRDFRSRDKPTNILSFTSEFEKTMHQTTSEPYHLGDLILSISTIQRECREQKKSLKDHVSHLIVHGCLHLLGHDHMKPDEAEKMEKLEIKILRSLGINNPYLLPA